MTRTVPGPRPKLIKVVLLALVAVLLLAGLAACGQPSLVEQTDEISAEMQVMVEQTEDGDVTGGEAAFSRAHDFFHEIDPLLRDRDPDLAAELWDTVLVIEYEYGGERNPEVLAREGRRILALLDEVRSLFEREGL